MKFSNRQIPPSTHERLLAQLEGFTFASGWNRPTIVRFAQRGGPGKAYQLFGEQLPKLLDELNQALAA